MERQNRKVAQKDRIERQNRKIEQKDRIERQKYKKDKMLEKQIDKKIETVIDR